MTVRKEVFNALERLAAVTKPGMSFIHISEGRYRLHANAFA